MGDSYSAGNGAGSYDTAAPGAYRSLNNWAQYYRRKLVERGVSTHLTNIAHSGYTTEQVANQQVKSIPDDADTVLLTIGGNDMNFDSVIEQCFAKGRRYAQECQKAVNAARRMMQDPGRDGLKARIMHVFSEIAEQLTSMDRYDVDIILVGYPNLVLPDSGSSYFIHSCKDPVDFPCSEYYTYRAGSELLRAAKVLEEVQRDAVVEWNRSLPPYPQVAPKARYIVSIPEHFRGHEPDPSLEHRNSKRWINEFFETKGLEQPDGNTDPTLSLDKMEWYHPNLTGQKQIGEVLLKEIGIPRVAREALPPNASPNAEPNARAPKPMLAWIQGPYAKDNCPEVNNHGQTDEDGDGIGDECDPTPGYPNEDRPGVGEGEPPTTPPIPSPSPTPDPLPTAPPSATATPSPSTSPTKTPSPKPSKTPSPSPSPSESPSVTAEPTVSPSESVSPLPTVTPSAAPTGHSPSATATPTVTEPPTMSPEPTDIPVPTVSPTSAPPVLPSPTSAPEPTAPQPTISEPPGVPVPSQPVPPDPTRPRPGLPNTGA